MPKTRKKYPRLPNGYGQIRYLGKNRRNPYGVYPPADETDGRYHTKAICYVDNWMKGFSVLTAWHAGNYYKGMERDILEEKAPDKLAEKLLADYNQAFYAAVNDCKTFAEVYEEFYARKFKHAYTDKSARPTSTENCYRAAYKHCQPIWDKKFNEIKTADMQAVMDTSYSHATLEHIKLLCNQLFKYAIEFDIVDKNYAQFVVIGKEDDDEGSIPFTTEEINLLWKHKKEPIVETILIMCYSGYRISAYETIKVNLKEQYFQGGVKTASGKNRIVPIHSAIMPMVTRRIKQDGKIINISQQDFRRKMSIELDRIGIKGHHTPHDCRHTFSKLCEKYGVRDADRKRMMGHSFGGDITNAKYGNRDLEDLRAEIEKIKV